MEYKWYIANVVSGQEQAVCNEIKGIIEKEGPDCRMNDALLPTKTVLKVKRGKKVEEKQKLFPGYVFVNIEPNGDVFSRIRSLGKVLGFLGPKNSPSPVTDAKISKIIEEAAAEPTAAGDLDAYEIGETVKVIQGPFESFTGVIEDKDLEKKRIKLSVSIFGRATSVDLDVSQIEKLDN